VTTGASGCPPGPIGGSVILTVEDSGPGVPPEIAARIFDPFFSTKGVGNGLGLGLSISYNILKDFGGELALDSGSMGGAAFRGRLRSAEPVVDPFCKRPPPNDHRTALCACACRGRRRDLRASTAQALELAGIGVQDSPRPTA
jgi:hypothetical protein